MPILFGCSKESNAIVGDWYICSTEYSDSSDPELYHFKEYTKENTIGFVSYTADGKGIVKGLDDEGQSVVVELKFHWTLSNDKLTVTYEGTNKSESETIKYLKDETNIIFIQQMGQPTLFVYVDIIGISRAH